MVFRGAERNARDIQDFQEGNTKCKFKNVELLRCDEQNLWNHFRSEIKKEDNVIFPYRYA